MRRIWKVAGAVAAVPLCGAVVLGATVQARWDRTFDAPEAALQASTDPDVIAQGRYLAYGPAHCALCHSRQELWPAIEAGEEPAIAGGGVFVLPFGTFHSPNLTPDAETGIGRYTDAQLVRMLRHGIRPDGRVALPFMEFQNLSDADVVAIISFLRSQEPVHNRVPDHEVNAVGRAIYAFLLRPRGPEGTPPSAAPLEEATIERGDYLVNNVANCAGCHSQRNEMDGSYSGPRLAGGYWMPMDDDASRAYVTPNLTPDPETGAIHGWSEERFVERFRAGRVFASSHMPWGSFSKMSDTDLRAIYRYLNSVEPVHHVTGPSIQPLAARP